MTWTGAITLAIAVLGAALGIINTWHSINDRRVKLRVRPLWGLGLQQTLFGIEVTNLSTFAVTLDDVGFLFGRPTTSTPERACFMQPILTDGGPWPRRLEPRSSVTAYTDVTHLPLGRSFWAAYARTACGELRHARSPALRQLSDMASQK